MEKCTHCAKFCHKFYLHNPGPGCGVFGRIFEGVGEQRPESRLLIYVSPHTLTTITNFSPFSVLLCPYVEPDPATAVAQSFPQIDWDPLCTHLRFVCMKFPVILGPFLLEKKDSLIHYVWLAPKKWSFNQQYIVTATNVNINDNIIGTTFSYYIIILKCYFYYCSFLPSLTAVRLVFYFYIYIYMYIHTHFSET